MKGILELASKGCGTGDRQHARVVLIDLAGGYFSLKHRLVQTLRNHKRRTSTLVLPRAYLVKHGLRKKDLTRLPVLRVVTI